MAQDWEQKSVQGIKDPAARKAAYYRLQRQSAEDGQDYGTLDKINSKLGKKTQKTTWNEPQESAERDFGIAASMTPLGRAEKLGAAALSKIPKFAETGTSIASKVEGALSGAAQKARQFLGEAKPVAKRLEGGARKVASRSPKALESRARALKPASTRPALKPATEQKALMKPKNAQGPRGEELRPSGRAASSPAKRIGPNENRYNPKSGKPVGKSPMRIKSDVEIRQGRKAANEMSAEMNRKAATQNPRSRAMRSNDLMDKPGSAKKGGYSAKKLKSKAEASAK